MTAEEAIASRRSVRAFLGTPVPRGTVERILDIAARAPSGTNMQPWRGYALTGEPLKRLSAALVAEALAGAPAESEYRYYPEAFFEPYLSRRRKVGWDLYGLLGIAPCGMRGLVCEQERIDAGGNGIGMGGGPDAVVHQQAHGGAGNAQVRGQIV